MHAWVVVEAAGTAPRSPGTQPATDVGMAAVFALVFVPGLAAILFMLGADRGALSASTAFAATVFIALAVGVFMGLYRLAHKWEDEHPSGT